jgi:aryl-alcohol dehydrogenase-like predicted oxidoreductase
MNSEKLSNEMGPPVSDEYVYKVVDDLDAVAKETGKTVPQIALNWQRKSQSMRQARAFNWRIRLHQ